MINVEDTAEARLLRLEAQVLALRGVIRTLVLETIANDPERLNAYLDAGLIGIEDAWQQEVAQLPPAAIREGEEFRSVACATVLELLAEVREPD